MLTRRTNGMDPINALRGEVEHLFDEFLHGAPGRSRFGWPMSPAFPALNIWEDEHNVRVEAELSGLKLEDLDISVVGNELTIKGERKARQPEDVVYHRRERGTGAFSRVLRLPVDIDANRVEASLKNGVLTITLPKAEAAKPRKIQIKATEK